MKRVMLSLALVIGLGLTHINAQDAGKISFGVKGEANMSNFNLSDMPGVKSDFGVGATIGGFTKIDINRHFAIQPELLLNWQNSTLKFDGKENDYQYWGMEIPVYAVGQMKLTNGDRAYIGIGPYARLGFSAKNTTTDENLYKENGNAKAFMQRGDVGAGAMIGYEFAFGMQINASYKYGFLNVLDAASDNSTMNNQMISFGIGYTF